MKRKSEPSRSVFNRIRAAMGRVRRAITGVDGGDKEDVDPRIGQMRDHEQRKMNDFVELAEERGPDGEGDRDESRDEKR